MSRKKLTMEQQRNMLMGVLARIVDSYPEIEVKDYSEDIFGTYLSPAASAVPSDIILAGRRVVERIRKERDE